MTHRSQFVECVRCRSVQQSYIQLDCSHSYCLICASYSYLKKMSQNKTNQPFDCEVCLKKTQLDNQTLQHLKDLIHNQIIPKINQTSASKQKFSIHDQTNLDFTPAIMLPDRLSKFISIKKSCLQHPRQPIEFSCLTCRIQNLCWKCISNGKHRFHDLQSAQSGIQLIKDKIELSKIKIKQKQQELVLKIHRINEITGILNQRAQRTAVKINRHFQDLQSRMKQVQSKILINLNDSFNQMQNTLKIKLRQYQRYIDVSRTFKIKIQALQDSYQNRVNPLLNDIMQLMQQLDQQIQPRFIDQFSFLKKSQNMFDLREMIPVMEALSKIRLVYEQEQIMPYSQQKKQPKQFQRVRSEAGEKKDKRGRQSINTQDRQSKRSQGRCNKRVSQLFSKLQQQKQLFNVKRNSHSQF